MVRLLEDRLKITIRIDHPNHRKKRIFFILSLQMMIVCLQSVKRIPLFSYHHHPLIIFLFFFLSQIELLGNIKLLAQRNPHRELKPNNFVLLGETKGQIFHRVIQHRKRRNKLLKFLRIRLLKLQIIDFSDFLNIINNIFTSRFFPISHEGHL